VLQALAAPAKSSDLEIPHITVSGTAITKAVPDKVVWWVRIKNTGADLRKVAEKHAEMTASLIKEVKSFGVDDKDIQTARMEFGEHMVDRGRQRVKEGYEATTEATFALADLAKYKDVWLRMADTSGLTVRSVSYDLSKRIELQKETRRKALLAAREKAGVMAETLDAKVGEVLSISEDLAAAEGWNGGNGIFNSVAQASSVAGNGDGEGGDVIAPGTIPIRIRVQVSFRLVSADK